MCLVCINIVGKIFVQLKEKSVKDFLRCQITTTMCTGSWWWRILFTVLAVTTIAKTDTYYDELLNWNPAQRTFQDVPDLRMRQTQYEAIRMKESLDSIGRENIFG